MSPTKSFSTLWALAPLATSQQLEELHRQAVAKVVEYLETQAFSRVGPHGVRNVETRGLVAVAFTHRDSRAGDPDLHTHLVIANKVQSTDGRWYALNTNLIYKAKVAASELYSATLEASLAETFGIRFVERSTGAGKRPVREIDGVDLALAARWSTRRGQIEHRRDELAAAFLADHGRPPTEPEMIALAQRANLETREAKHEPRSHAEQRATWREQAEQVLGAGGVDSMLATVFDRLAVQPKTPSIDWLIGTSARVIGILESERSTWQSWHVRAEALRQTRAAGVPAELLERVVDTIVDLAAARPARSGSASTTRSRSPAPCGGRTARASTRSPAWTGTPPAASSTPSSASSPTPDAPTDASSTQASSTSPCSKPSPTGRS